MKPLNAFIEVLQLDNFLQILTPFERMQVNLYRAAKTCEVPKIVLLLNGWIEQNHWKPPEFRYNDLRELLYREDQEWKPINQHKLYKKEINLNN